MTKTKPPDSKIAVLRQQGSLNPHPDRVKDPLFTSAGFFDARDLVQVKYEMVRRVRLEGQSVSYSAAAFGFSRPSFYHAKALLEQGGLAALVSSKPGPRRSHKLSPEVVDFVRAERSLDASLSPQQLSLLVLKRFQCKVHPRSIKRALDRQEKKRP